MGTSVTIEPFAAATASDAEFRERYELTTAVEREFDPDDTVEPFDQWRREVMDTPSWAKPLRWSARNDTGRLVGTAMLGLQYTESNRHLAHFHITVAAGDRRAGVGSRLLAAIVAAAAEDGRTVLGANAEEGTCSEAFLAALGMEKRLVDRRSRLLVGEVDAAMLDEWIATAATAAAGYSLMVWEDGVPDEYLDAFVSLEHVMNTAPRDDLDMEDWVTTPERFRESEQRGREQGYRWWTIVARHDATDALVGFTQLAFAPYEADIAWQQGTAVDPVHRNHGIGRWLKAAMIRKLQAERPEVWRIDTWNAGSNATMLGINIALGFRPVKHHGAFQAPTEKLAAAVAERFG